MLELPALQRFSEDAELQGVRVVTVVSGEEVPKARDLLAKVRYTFPVVFDAESRVADSYKVSAVPQVVIVTEGRVKARFVGEGRFHRLVDAIRAETGVSEVDQAGSSGEEPIPLVERGGRYVMAGESKGNWSVPISKKILKIITLIFIFYVCSVSILTIKNFVF